VGARDRDASIAVEFKTQPHSLILANHTGSSFEARIAEQGFMRPGRIPDFGGRDGRATLKWQQLAN
jgi:hypothetical protein